MDVGNCQKVLEKIQQTWDPPLYADPKHRNVSALITCVQTGAVGMMAFTMGTEFPWHILTPVQREVTRQSVKVYEDFLNGGE